MSIELEAAEKALESYRPGVIKVRKGGGPTEQDPYPICDPLSGASFEIALDREYIMPMYMADVLESAYKPLYESQINEVTGEAEEYKQMRPIHVMASSKEISDLKKYVKDNPNIKLLFEVPESTINAKKAEIKKLAVEAKKGKKGDTSDDL